MPEVQRIPPTEFQLEHIVARLDPLIREETRYLQRALGAGHEYIRWWAEEMLSSIDYLILACSTNELYGAFVEAMEHVGYHPNLSDEDKNKLWDVKNGTV